MVVIRILLLYKKKMYYKHFFLCFAGKVWWPKGSVLTLWVVPCTGQYT